MTFKTVFDITQTGYGAWWFPSAGLIFVAIGAVWVFAPNLSRRMMPSRLPAKATKIFSWIFLLFAILWTAANFAGTYDAYRQAADALNGGSAAVAEGPVTDFLPMPYSGHSLESFTVAGHRFSYSDYVVSPGFHNTTSHGGPIRQGLYVRVTYIGNTIVRLEVAQ